MAFPYARAVDETRGCRFMQQATCQFAGLIGAALASILHGIKKQERSA
jgi:hypothetical protein